MGWWKDVMFGLYENVKGEESSSGNRFSATPTHTWFTLIQGWKGCQFYFAGMNRIVPDFISAAI